MTDPLLRSRDREAREAALDTTRSFLVQAPAGSGKTDLLTRRFLKLLSTVDEPEEILAITFTRAATAEMRARIISDLECARQGGMFSDPSRASIATAALRQSELRGWRLLEQPGRLDIRTIDSVCLRLAHEQPLMARLGGQLKTTDDAALLYREAARRTLSHLGGNSELGPAVRHLLSLRDNVLSDCETLIAGMLAEREQWVHAFPLSRDVDWDEVRLTLETNIRRAVRDTLQRAHNAFSRSPTWTTELIELAHYACCNDAKIDIALLSGLRSLPGPSEVRHWHCLTNLLLTGEKGWRKQLNKNYGFPPKDKGQKKRMEAVIQQLSRDSNLLPTLCAVRALPCETTYSDEQWQALRSVFIVLRAAVAELRVIFAEANVIDHTEASLAAQQVLHEPGERTLAATERIRHLLVDEFQDTSLRQHALIAALTADWVDGDGHTCFLVGDPMQSVYLFRQAEVELFTRVARHGRIAPDLAWGCDSLTLSQNFRSHHALVTPLNEHFDRIFAERADEATSVPFSPSFADEVAYARPAVTVHANYARSDERREARKRESAAVLSIIREHLSTIEHAQAAGREFRIAILGRARSHLASIAQLLRDASIPFRSIDLERLGDRQEIRDLLSLTRALLHPMDRIAWLGTLRAPWCGLTLRDLHMLCGSDDKAHQKTSVLELIGTRSHLLSSDGQRRLARIRAALERALTVRYDQAESPSFSAWIERTWRALGGEFTLDAAGRENAATFFRMLDSIAPDGVALFTDAFEDQLTRLFAQPDPSVNERCGIHLMTIHKAKGLGFDVVIVPGLDRKLRNPEKELVCALERPAASDPRERELLLAPIGNKGGESASLYTWIRGLKDTRDVEELKRIFYVACTRARSELHLLGTASIDSDGSINAPKNTLLASAWPALADEFARQRQAKVVVLPQPETISIAASAESPRLTLRRLPEEFLQQLAREAETRMPVAFKAANAASFNRPEGSRLARATGSIIHSVLEKMAGGEVRPEILEQQAARMLRAASIAGTDHRRAMGDITAAIRSTINDPIGMWLLDARSSAQSESSWSGYLDQHLRTVRADRIFRAGAEPYAEGENYLWVIDYKTSEGRGDVNEFLATQRIIYGPQLTAYGRILRAVHGEQTPLRLALYYPRLSKLDYWEG